jgi:hypothetical protein
MEKYIVIVNRKYLISVEAGSHGGAEHLCLDLVYGIDTAQAFSRDDLRTEFFRDAAIECETISFSELVAKSEAYKAHIDRAAECNYKRGINASRAAELRRELEALAAADQALRDEIVEATIAANSIF